jgi:hypothetical protein
MAILAVSRTAKPKKKIPEVRNVRNVAIDDEIGEPAEKGNNMTNEIDRGPFAKMLDRQALAHQAQFGGTYEQAYVKIYTDPSNRSIVDNARLNHLEQSHDAIYGTKLSPIPVAKASQSYDPLAKAAELAEHLGPAHAKLHSMAVDHYRLGLHNLSLRAHGGCPPAKLALRLAQHVDATQIFLNLLQNIAVPDRSMGTPICRGRREQAIAVAHRALVAPLPWLLRAGVARVVFHLINVTL